MAAERKKITPDEINQIIATYVETNNKSVTANYLDLSFNTVDKYIRENKETVDKLMAQKKEEFINSVLDFDKSLSKLKTSNKYLAQQIMNKGLKKDANISDAVKV